MQTAKKGEAMIPRFFRWLFAAPPHVHAWRELPCKFIPALEEPPAMMFGIPEGMLYGFSEFMDRCCTCGEVRAYRRLGDHAVSLGVAELERMSRL